MLIRAFETPRVTIQHHLLTERLDVVAQKDIKRRVLKNTFTEHKVEVKRMK